MSGASRPSSGMQKSSKIIIDARSSSGTSGGKGRGGTALRLNRMNAVDHRGRLRLQFGTLSVNFVIAIP